MAAQLTGYAGNLFRSSSYDASASEKRSRHSEPTADPAALWKRVLGFLTRNELVDPPACAFCGLNHRALQGLCLLERGREF